MLNCTYNELVFSDLLIFGFIEAMLEFYCYLIYHKVDLVVKCIMQALLLREGNRKIYMFEPSHEEFAALFLLVPPLLTKS